MGAFCVWISFLQSLNLIDSDGFHKVFLSWSELKNCDNHLKDFNPEKGRKYQNMNIESSLGRCAKAHSEYFEMEASDSMLLIP